MPHAYPPLRPLQAAPLSMDEIAFIKDTVAQIYGYGAVVRNFDPDPAWLELHVKTDRA